MNGPPSEDKIVFDLELPAAPMSERAAAFLEAINKQTQIDQVRSRPLDTRRYVVFGIRFACTLAEAVPLMVLLG